MRNESLTLSEKPGIDGSSSDPLNSARVDGSFRYTVSFSSYLRVLDNL